MMCSYLATWPTLLSLFCVSLGFLLESSIGGVIADPLVEVVLPTFCTSLPKGQASSLLVCNAAVLKSSLVDAL